jgi:SAM-dependent methyltransferase
MSTGYTIAYRLGLTPWERAGEGGADQLSELLAKEEVERSAPFGTALDLGCGTGTHTLTLAARGWRAIGVDNVRLAVDQARKRPGADAATFLIGDVTDLPALGLDPGISLFLDIGCFHGLSDLDRTRVGAGVTALAAPDATLLILAFSAGHRIALPRGADQNAITGALPGWNVVSIDDADTSGMPAPLRRTAPRWFRLRHIRHGVDPGPAH